MCADGNLIRHNVRIKFADFALSDYSDANPDISSGKAKLSSFRFTFLLISFSTGELSLQGRIS